MFSIAKDLLSILIEYLSTSGSKKATEFRIFIRFIVFACFETIFRINFFEEEFDG